MAPAAVGERTYKELREAEREASAGLPRVLDLLKDAKGRRVLLFSHDDPDGIASAALARRLLRRRGAQEVKVVLPPRYLLEVEEVEAEGGSARWDLLVVTDKGSPARYDRLPAAVEDVVVVDHHFTPEPPTKVSIYNPTFHGAGYCSASYLWHIVGRLLDPDLVDPADDFDALVGLKADFAIDPAKDYDGSPLVAPGVAALRESYPNLFAKVPNAATLFDSGARDRTSLLSQIAEVYFAVCGGGFQFFYGHRDPALKGIDPPRFLLEQNEAIVAEPAAIRRAKTLETFLSLFPDRAKVDRILGHFRADWERVPDLLRLAVPVARVKTKDGVGTTVYLFLGDRLTLFPFVAGIVLDELVRRDGAGEGVMVVANRDGGGGVHFCLRGTGESLHVGKICAATAARLVARHGQENEISGGGHAKAGECQTRGAKGVLFGEALRVLLDLLEETAAKGDVP